MSDQQLELAKPNLQQPLTERVWRYLKENPNKDCKTISEALGEPRGPISSTVGSLERRNLVLKTCEGLKDPNGKGFDKWIHGNLWACSDADNPPNFNVRRRQPKPDTRLYRKLKPVATLEAVTYVPPAVKSTDEKAQDFVGNLTLDLAHAVYLKLKTYFEPKVL